VIRIWAELAKGIPSEFPRLHRTPEQVQWGKWALLFSTHPIGKNFEALHMSNGRKQFLRVLRETWKTEFPFLKSVDINETPKIAKGCNFRCDDYFTTRGVYYFITFDFSQRRQGEFSLGVTGSDSAEKSVLDLPDSYVPSPTNVGSYSVAVFLNCQSFRWDLVDVNARTDAILASFGAPPITAPGYVSPNTWRPSSYAMPFRKIADEAVRDVSDKLRRFVFPKLEIAVTN
jgi:hypothetical protein